MRVWVSVQCGIQRAGRLVSKESTSYVLNKTYTAS
jgi:hypothetical protein